MTRPNWKRPSTSARPWCYILAGPGDDGPLGTARGCRSRRSARNVPVLVDAAAEILTIKPMSTCSAARHAVAYSGGKCIRGPQAAGLLLGDKSLLQGAWINSAPHHAFGRSVKVGKEEIMGMLAAVEMWVKRDHKAEWAQWEGWLDHIATSVKRVDGVTTKVNQPSADLSNRTPALQIQWDGAKARDHRAGSRQACCSIPSRASSSPAAAERAAGIWPAPSPSFRTR